MSFMDNFYLTGKTAIVTGGAKGLGLGMTQALCEAGAQVAIISSSDSAKTKAQELCGQGFDVYGIKADLSKRESVQATFDEALNHFGGKLDILVNNSGMIRRHKSEEYPLEDWDMVINLNLNTVFQLCQLAGKVMLKQGSGKIINIASMLSFFGGYTVPAYSASKGGVAQLTKALANEWSGKNVQVNVIAPGYMATDINQALMDDAGRSQEILSRIPAGRWGTPEDMKGIVVFLASAASDYVNGAIIPVDGAYLAR